MFMFVELLFFGTRLTPSGRSIYFPNTLFGKLDILRPVRLWGLSNIQVHTYEPDFQYWICCLKLLLQPPFYGIHTNNCFSECKTHRGTKQIVYFFLIQNARSTGCHPFLRTIWNYQCQVYFWSNLGRKLTVNNTFWPDVST